MAFFSKFKKKEGDDDKMPDAAETEKEKEQTQLKERKILCLLEGVRNLFLELNLSGSVEICSSFAAFSFSNELDIDATEDKIHNSIDLMKDKETRIHRTAMNMSKRVLKKMISRARVYKGRPYMNKTTLTQSFGISLGFIGVELEFDATVDSLLGITEDDVGDDGAEDGGEGEEG